MIETIKKDMLRTKLKSRCRTGEANIDREFQKGQIRTKKESWTQCGGPYQAYLSQKNSVSVPLLLHIMTSTLHAIILICFYHLLEIAVISALKKGIQMIYNLWRALPLVEHKPLLRNTCPQVLFQEAQTF